MAEPTTSTAEAQSKAQGGKKEDSKAAPSAMSAKDTNGKNAAAMKADTDDAPEGFVEQTDDLEAYYDPDQSGAILFTPKHAKLFDSQIEPHKPSTLITATLEKPAMLVTADDDKELQEFPAGTVFGIWAKPGMRPLKRLAGVVVYMKLKGEKATGKPNPMKTFDVKSREPGRPLQVAEDKREKSLPASLRNTPKPTETDEFSDIPF